eukprot:7804500-Pyramimonas_sp.AAC.1
MHSTWRLGPTMDVQAAKDILLKAAHHFEHPSLRLVSPPTDTLGGVRGLLRWAATRGPPSW